MQEHRKLAEELLQIVEVFFLNFLKIYQPKVGYHVGKMSHVMTHFLYSNEDTGYSILTDMFVEEIDERHCSGTLECGKYFVNCEYSTI